LHLVITVSNDAIARLDIDCLNFQWKLNLRSELTQAVASRTSAGSVCDELVASSEHHQAAADFF
jgi:hypothetical protein